MHKPYQLPQRQRSSSSAHCMVISLRYVTQAKQAEHVNDVTILS